MSVRRADRWIAAGAVALLVAGCSVVAGSPPDPNLPCRIVDGVDPCPQAYGLGSRMRCSDDTGADGVCESPECSLEQCGNGADDDCDGNVDEGSAEVCNDADDDCDGVVDNGLDGDTDGYSWCATAPGDVDCDDDDPDVNPGRADDPCDGLDNDCRPGTVDGETQCSSDQICDAMQGCVDIHCGNRPSLCNDTQFCDSSTTPPSCQPREMRCFVVPCEGTQRCNPRTGLCVPGNLAVGAPCDFDVECQTGLCVPRQAAGLPDTLTSGRFGVCSRLCCEDAVCGANELCWAPGTGTQLCLPRTIFDGSTHGAPAQPLCTSNESCADVCTARRDSAYETSARVAASCGTSSMGGSGCEGYYFLGVYYDSCVGNPGQPLCMRDGSCGLHDCDTGADCDSGLCVGGICVDGCGRSEDCRTSFYNPFGRASCGFRNVTVDGASGVRPICLYQSSGDGRSGMVCSTDSDCRDRTCVDDSGVPSGVDTHCADTCCSDDHCAPTDQCRPTYVRATYEMHCLPRPVFGPLGMTP